MVVTDDARLQAAGLEAKEDVSWAHGPRLRAKGISPQNEYRCAVGHCEGPSSPRDAGVGPLERPALQLSSDSTSAGLRLKMDPLFKDIDINDKKKKDYIYSRQIKGLSRYYRSTCFLNANLSEKYPHATICSETRDFFCIGPKGGMSRCLYPLRVSF